MYVLNQSFVQAGSLFAILTFIHFVSDWVFQSHKEALSKSHDWKVRARHCLMYLIGFAAFFMVLNLHGWKYVICAVLLYGSHFFIDTYLPVLWWAKYIRRFPEFQPSLVPRTDEEVLRAVFSTPVGALLCITIDQLCHISMLWGVVMVIMF